MEVLSTTASRKLLTKYFYKENQLMFQILLSIDLQKNMILGEYTNYTEYKNAFKILLEKVETNAVIDLSENNENNLVAA